jgi:hypothetical protein
MRDDPMYNSVITRSYGTHKQLARELGISENRVRKIRAYHKRIQEKTKPGFEEGYKEGWNDCLHKLRGIFKRDEDGQTE